MCPHYRPSHATQGPGGMTRRFADAVKAYTTCKIRRKVKCHHNTNKSTAPPGTGEDFQLRNRWRWPISNFQEHQDSLSHNWSWSATRSAGVPLNFQPTTAWHLQPKSELLFPKPQPPHCRSHSHVSPLPRCWFSPPFPRRTGTFFRQFVHPSSHSPCISEVSSFLSDILSGTGCPPDHQNPHLLLLYPPLGSSRPPSHFLYPVQKILNNSIVLISPLWFWPIS